MKRKLLSILLAFVLVFPACFMLSACKDDDENTDDSGVDNVAAEVTLATKEEVKHKLQTLSKSQNGFVISAEISTSKNEDKVTIAADGEGKIYSELNELYNIIDTSIGGDNVVFYTKVTKNGLWKKEIRSADDDDLYETYNYIMSALPGLLTSYLTEGGKMLALKEVGQSKVQTAGGEVDCVRYMSNMGDKGIQYFYVDSETGLCVKNELVPASGKPKDENYKSVLLTQYQADYDIDLPTDLTGVNLPEKLSWTIANKNNIGKPNETVVSTVTIEKFGGDYALKTNFEETYKYFKYVNLGEGDYAYMEYEKVLVDNEYQWKKTDKTYSEEEVIDILFSNYLPDFDQLLSVDYTQETLYSGTSKQMLVRKFKTEYKTYYVHFDYGILVDYAETDSKTDNTSGWECESLKVGEQVTGFSIAIPE